MVKQFVNTYSSPRFLHVIRGETNPRSAPGAELFLIVGDATLPVQNVLFDAELPPRQTDLHDFHLRVLHINDLHGHLAHVTAHDQTPIFSRIVSRVRASRQLDDANSATIFLSAGDDLVGTAFEELLCNESLHHRFNAAYRLYSEAGLDAAALGNHEFDVGTRLLADSIRNDASFPILSANLNHCAQLATLCFPAAILVTKGVRVGLIGLTTAAEIIHRDDPNFSIAHPVAVARNLVPVVRPLCDVLIGLTHIGHNLAATTAVVQDAGDVELAQSLPIGAFDLIVGGHTHTALNARGLDAHNVVNGVVITQAGANGDWLGQVEMVLSPRVTILNVALLATNKLPEEETFERDHVQPLAEQVSGILAEHLGCVEEVEARTAGFASHESEVANFIADALVKRCRRAGYDVDWAMVDQSSLECDLENGVLTFEDWFELMPHADVMRLYQIRGDQLQALLDDNARRADRPGEFSGDNGFLQFSRDLRYTIELDATRDDTHATAIRVNDIPLDEQLARTFRFVCSSFARQRDASWQARAADNRWRAASVRELAWTDTPLRIRDELIAYIRSHGGVTPASGARCDGRVKFA